MNPLKSRISFDQSLKHNEYIPDTCENSVFVIVDDTCIVLI